MIVLDKMKIETDQELWCCFQKTRFFSVIILGRAIGANLSPMAHENMTYWPRWLFEILDGVNLYHVCSEKKS